MYIFQFITHAEQFGSSDTKAEVEQLVSVQKTCRLETLLRDGEFLEEITLLASLTPAFVVSRFAGIIITIRLILK